MQERDAKRRNYRFGNCTLTLEFGDILSSTADVIVSSDDFMLTMGGGVSAAIRRAGGADILVDAAKKAPARLGDVVVTTAGNLPAAYVFHAITIGENDRTDAPRSVIERTTRRCFELLDTFGLHSIAFPAIGAGLAGFSYEDVAVCMAEVIVGVFRTRERTLHATIYLYDRFGKNSFIEFMRFFEEFGGRVRSFDATEAEQNATNKMKSDIKRAGNE